MKKVSSENKLAFIPDECYFNLLHRNNQVRVEISFPESKKKFTWLRYGSFPLRLQCSLFTMLRGKWRASMLGTESWE
jgi:hypothetical protein